MLAIRMQRTGRKGYASFRIVVQDSQFAPTSGRVVAKLGHYNPHTKETVINKEKAEKYLKNGAQPSLRVVKLFTEQKIKLPEWVEKIDTKKTKKIKNSEKLRKNRPQEEDVSPEPEEVKDNPEEDTTEPKEEAPEAEEVESDDAKETEVEASEEKSE